MAEQILGISAYYHDSAAALLRGGDIIAAAQEERFSRRKHDPAFPVAAVSYCLDAGGCDLQDLDAIIFYDKPLLKFERLLETYLARAPIGFRSYIRAMPVWLKEKLFLKRVLRRELRELAGISSNVPLPRLLFSEHHLSHAASAFFPSPFEEAVVVCLDGVGEWATSSAWLGSGNSLEPLWEIQFPHSLGLLYSAFTYFCGFRVNSGEYKLMGLAPYGRPRYVETIREHLIDVKQDGSFALNMRYFNFATGLTMTNEAFARLFGGPALAMGSTITQREMDLARSIQVVTEDIILLIVGQLAERSTCRNLCLAGGVALNCVANGRIRDESPFEHIWIQPAAGDAGGALGAAYVAGHRYFEWKRLSTAPGDAMQGACLGPRYSEEEVFDCLREAGLDYEPLGDNVNRIVAEELASGHVVGWFQGRMEFGPRALGNRSILGDPRDSAMQTKMNLKIKNRESFRPFAPAVLEEDTEAYFDNTDPSPYMLLVSKIREELRREVDSTLLGFELLKQERSTLPAITHVDYSARVQTVNAATNPEFHRLLSEFKNLTGCGVLINTSFNVRGEPPVCSPADAVRCFLATDMDTLVIGRVRLQKSKQPAAAISAARQTTFEPD